jgi:hypothetical protein
VIAVLVLLLAAVAILVAILLRRPKVPPA